MAWEAEIFTLWTFTEKVHQPWFFTAGHIECPLPSSLHVLGPHKSPKKNVNSIPCIWKSSPLLSTWQKPSPILTCIRSSLFWAPSNFCIFTYYSPSPPWPSPYSCYELLEGRFLPYSTLTRQETVSGTDQNYSINISQMSEFHCQLCEGTFWHK